MIEGGILFNNKDIYVSLFFILSFLSRLEPIKMVSCSIVVEQDTKGNSKIIILMGLEKKP